MLILFLWYQRVFIYSSELDMNIAFQSHEATSVFISRMKEWANKLLKYSRSEDQSCSSSVFVGCQLVALYLMIWKLSLLKAPFIHPHLLLLALASPKPQQASAKLSLQTVLRSSWTRNLRAMSWLIFLIMTLAKLLSLQVRSHLHRVTGQQFKPSPSPE